MKSNIIIKLAIILISVNMIICCDGCDERSKTVKQVSEVRQKEYRSVTVINKLNNPFARSCVLENKDGVMIGEEKKDVNVSNIVFKNFDENGAFENESEFRIILIDRYDMKYMKVFTANSEGNTDVVISESDQVKQSGDWIRGIEKWLNE